MRKKIIVTGGCGYIGSHTVIELIENGYDLLVFDNLSNSTEISLDRIEQITGIRPAFIQIDLSDAKETNILFKRHQDAYAVIHFAAHKAVGESVLDPLKYYQNNLYVLINTLSAQRENGINKFIFSSSATVYGDPDQLPVTEESEQKRATSPYGNTKKIGEEILEDLTKSDVNFSAISLRYFNPIGAHASGFIGEIPSGIPNNLMPYITQTAAGIRQQLLVYGNDYPTPDGTAIRDYIHVVDLAQAHVVALKRLLEQKQESPLEVFNLGTAKGYSVLEVIHSFESVTQVQLNYKLTDRRAGDIASLYAATEKAEKKLGWKAQKGLDEMMRSSWDWEQHYRSQQ
tara:strand:+ start:304 stop:1332 length:1029 start_codon:yes stop_codon:yes gene_type:complete